MEQNMNQTRRKVFGIDIYNSVDELLKDGKEIDSENNLGRDPRIATYGIEDQTGKKENIVSKLSAAYSTSLDAIAKRVAEQLKDTKLAVITPGDIETKLCVIYQDQEGLDLRYETVGEIKDGFAMASGNLVVPYSIQILK